MTLVPSYMRVPIATCSSVAISNFGDFSGTYEEVATTYDAFYSMDGALDIYILYLYRGAWNLEPDEANYPKYRVSQEVSHFPLHWPPT